jgi:hypothetical protein
MIRGTSWRSKLSLDAAAGRGPDAKFPRGTDEITHSISFPVRFADRESGYDDPPIFHN